MATLPEQRPPTAAGQAGQAPHAPATRGVTEADLPELLRVERETFPQDPYPYFVLRQLVDIHREHFLVAEEAGRLRGYALFVTAPGGSVSWIMSLAVTPDQRSRGLGRRLMREVLHRVRADGIRAVRLTVDPANTPAVALYRSLGFAAEGEVREDYFGAGDHRLIMSLTL